VAGKRSAEMRAARLIAKTRRSSELEVGQLSPAVDLRPRLVVRSKLNQFYGRRTDRDGTGRSRQSEHSEPLIPRVAAAGGRPAVRGVRFPGTRPRSGCSSALHYSGRRASVTAPGRDAAVRERPAPESVNHVANSLTAAGAGWRTRIAITG